MPVYLQQSSNAASGGKKHDWLRQSLDTLEWGPYITNQTRPEFTLLENYVVAKVAEHENAVSGDSCGRFFDSLSQDIKTIALRPAFATACRRANISCIRGGRPEKGLEWSAWMWGELATTFADNTNAIPAYAESCN